MPNDDDPGHPINRQLRAAAGKGRFSTTPEQSATSRAVNNAIRRTAGRPATEPAQAPAETPATAGPVDWGGGPRGSLPPEPLNTSAYMNRWVRGAIRRSMTYGPAEED